MQLIPTDPEKRADFWRRVTIWVTVAAIVVAVGGIWEEHANADRIIDGFKKEADQTVATVREALKAERAAHEQTKKISIEGLLYDYNVRLKDLQQAAAAYVAAKRLPPNSEGAGARKAAAERQLYQEAAAFYNFVQTWRGVAKALGDILNGNADRLDQARQNSRADDVEDAVQILIRAAPSKRQALETEAEKLKI
jgi:hypothetical protein